MFGSLHPHPDAGFTANITLDGEYRPDTATLPEVAHEPMERLRQAATPVEVTERRETGSADAPGFTQIPALSTAVGGVHRDLVQAQVCLSMLDVTDPRRGSVIRLVLTATASPYPAVLDDFQDFVRTVRPDTDAAP